MGKTMTVVGSPKKWFQILTLVVVLTLAVPWAAFAATNINYVYVPSVVDDSGTVIEDGLVLFDPSDLLRNDSSGLADESNQTLTVTGVSEPVKGTVELLAAPDPDAGKIRFTPAPNYNGPASFR